MSDAYERVTWRGHKFDRRTVAAIKELEKRLGKRINIYQGSYNTSVNASGGTHAGGGAVDWWVSGVDQNRATRIARQVGFADWWRKPSQGDWNDHHHSILLGHLSASDNAVLQMQNYRAGGDGLWPLVSGDDPQPYRPDPIVVFDYAAWKREQYLRDRIRELTNDILTLVDRRKNLRVELERLT
jgi:hypothetical protein